VSKSSATVKIIWHGDEIKKQLKEGQRHAIAQGTNLIRDDAKRRCPYGRTRLTGVHLVDTIRARMKKGAAEGYVAAGGKEAPHAHLVENGTVRMQAQPFMRPAFDENIGAVKALHRKAMKKVVK